MSQDPAEVELSPIEFQLLRNLLEAETGIVLKESKLPMLQHRLRPLLVAAGVSRFGELLHVLDQPEKRFVVLSTVIDAITTNLTQWFREPEQLEIFERVFLRSLERELVEDPTSKVSLWSAGCSTGQEPYSLAMLVRETLPLETHGCFRIHATDIDSSAMAHAKEGRYHRDELTGLDPLRKKLHLREEEPDWFRVADPLKAMVKFSPRNLIHPETWGPGREHAIVCRNVLIYFSKKTQEKVLSAFQKRLQPGGFLFLGHSEGIQSQQHDLEYVGPSTYQKKR